MRHIDERDLAFWVRRAQVRRIRDQQAAMRSAAFGMATKESFEKEFNRLNAELQIAEGRTSRKKMQQQNLERLFKMGKG